MKYQQNIQAYLEKLGELGLPDLPEMTPVEARAIDVGPYIPKPVTDDADVMIENTTIPNQEYTIPARIYKPKTLSEPLKGIIYYHGGGYVVGSLDHYDPWLVELVKKTNIVIASVDYRLAPEHPFPTAMNDGFAAATWILNHADEFSMQTEHISIMGDSGGGGLAAAVNLKLRDENIRGVDKQILLYPMLDANFETQSYLTHDEVIPTRNAMQWFWNHYAQGAEDITNPYCAPLQAKDFSNLPDALIITCEYDPLHDEGEAYAKKLQQAGVFVEYKAYQAMLHGFLALTEGLESAQVASDDLINKIIKFI